MASTRSPIPRSTASVSVGVTANPSAWVTVRRCSPNATRNAVSDPALMMRNRSRWPGWALKNSGSAEGRPFTR